MSIRPVGSKQKNIKCKDYVNRCYYSNLAIKVHH